MGSVSPEELDFGELAPGDSAMQIATITNVGTAPLTVTRAEIGNGTLDYSLRWELPGCGHEIPEELWVQPGSGFWLEPGCAVDIEVTYTAMTAGEVQDALVFGKAEVLDPDVSLSWKTLSFQEVVWLKGRTDGENPATEPWLVGSVIDVESLWIEPGREYALDIRVTDPVGGGILATWGSDRDDVRFVTDTGLHTAAIIPKGAFCEGPTEFHLYAIMVDVEGYQFWADVTVNGVPEDYPIEPTCREREPRGGCGGEDSGPACRDTAAAGLVLAGFRRRRRG